jgi:acyl-CoA synthetase (AMP-forming)/AMP-acid ligase II
VKESAIVSLPHPRWGERPGALVVLQTGATPDEPALRAFLMERVAPWWVPDVFEFVDELPKTGVGKTDKKRLREEVAPRLAARLADSGPESPEVEVGG